MGKGVGWHQACRKERHQEQGNSFSPTRSDRTIGKGAGLWREKSEKPETSHLRAGRPRPLAVLGAGLAVRGCSGCGGGCSRRRRLRERRGRVTAAAVAGSSPSSAGSTRVRIPISSPVPAKVCLSPFSVVSDCPPTCPHSVSPSLSLCVDLSFLFGSLSPSSRSQAPL